MELSPTAFSPTARKKALLKHRAYNRETPLELEREIVPTALWAVLQQKRAIKKRRYSPLTRLSPWAPKVRLASAGPLPQRHVQQPNSQFERWQLKGHQWARSTHAPSGTLQAYMLPTSPAFTPVAPARPLPLNRPLTAFTSSDPSPTTVMSVGWPSEPAEAFFASEGSSTLDDFSLDLSRPARCMNVGSNRSLRPEARNLLRGMRAVQLASQGISAAHSEVKARSVEGALPVSQAALEPSDKEDEQAAKVEEPVVEAEPVGGEEPVVEAEPTMLVMEERAPDEAIDSEAMKQQEMSAPTVDYLPAASHAFWHLAAPILSSAGLGTNGTAAAWNGRAGTNASPSASFLAASVRGPTCLSRPPHSITETVAAQLFGGSLLTTSSTCDSAESEIMQAALEEPDEDGLRAWLDCEEVHVLVAQEKALEEKSRMADADMEAANHLIQEWRLGNTLYAAEEDEDEAASPLWSARHHVGVRVTVAQEKAEVGRYRMADADLYSQFDEEEDDDEEEEEDEAVWPFRRPCRKKKRSLTLHTLGTEMN